MTETIFTKQVAKREEERDYREKIEAELYEEGAAVLFNTFYMGISDAFNKSLTAQGYVVPRYEQAVEGLRSTAMAFNIVGLASGGFAMPLCFITPVLRFAAYLLDNRATNIVIGNVVPTKNLLALTWELAYHLTNTFKPLFDDFKEGKIPNKEIQKLVNEMVRSAFFHLNKTFKAAKEKDLKLSNEAIVGHFLAGAIFGKNHPKAKSHKLVGDDRDRSLGSFLNEASIFLVNPKTTEFVVGYVPKKHNDKYGAVSMAYNAVFESCIKHSEKYREIPGFGSRSAAPKEYISIGSIQELETEKLNKNRRDSDGSSSSDRSHDSAMLDSDLDGVSIGRSSTGSAKSDSSDSSPRTEKKYNPNSLFNSNNHYSDPELGEEFGHNNNSKNFSGSGSLFGGYQKNQDSKAGRVKGDEAFVPYRSPYSV